jgi:hypothetical protein
MDWVRIWSFFFFASLGVFACLSVVVTIGGFFNIRSLFRDLSEAKARAEAEQATDSSDA